MFFPLNPPPPIVANVPVVPLRPCAGLQNRRVHARYRHGDPDIALPVLNAPIVYSRPYDEQITAPMVQLIDQASNRLLPPERPSAILRRMDRKEYFLVQVSQEEDNSTEDGREGDWPYRPRQCPQCKILTKLSVRQHERARTNPARNPQARVKKVELRWGMADGDLAHKLDRLKKFLGEGKKVEVWFGKKRTRQNRNRQVETGERDGLVKKVRDFVTREIGGAEEKASDRQVEEGALSLFFEVRGKGLSGRVARENSLGKGVKKGSEEEKAASGQQRGTEPTNQQELPARKEGAEVS